MEALGSNEIWLHIRMAYVYFSLGSNGRRAEEKYGSFFMGCGTEWQAAASSVCLATESTANERNSQRPIPSTRSVKFDAYVTHSFAISKALIVMMSTTHGRLKQLETVNRSALRFTRTARVLISLNRSSQTRPIFCCHFMFSIFVPCRFILFKIKQIKAAKVK